MSKCNIPKLYLFMYKVINIAMDAHVVNEFMRSINTPDCQRGDTDTDNPETRLKQWNLWATG